jgi:hypothetical protein
MGIKGLPVKTPTDVLRIAVHLSGGDISLPKVPFAKVRTSRWARTKSDNPAREKFKFKKSAWAYGYQDMPADLVAKWKSKQSGIPALDLLEKISEEAVSELYNNGKYFLYFSKFIETDCISLTKSMFYGSFPLVTRVGAVGEKVQKYIDWLKTKNYTDVRIPMLYDIPPDRLIPSGFGPENERHPNDSSSGLYDEQERMKVWLSIELAKEVTGVMSLHDKVTEKIDETTLPPTTYHLPPTYLSWAGIINFTPRRWAA